MDKCFGCPYDAKKCIGSAGNPNADIVIVGEAPGGEEMIQGRPFIGPSGKLLYRALARAGISDPEESCFITNAISCRPPDKEAPSTAALEACRMRLIEEVNAHPRKLVIGLGNSALRSLDCNMKAKISQERGQPKPNNPYLAMFTWHPAAVLRDGNRWPQMREDIAYAVSLATGGAIRRNPGESQYIEVTDDATAIEWAEKLATKKLLAADIETSGLNPRDDRITYLGISYKENETVIFPKELIHHLRSVFESGPSWVWHNGKFDTYFLQEIGMPARCDEDVMVMHYATCEQRGTHDLKQLSQDLLGAESYEDGVKEWIRKEKVKRRKDARSVTRFYARQETAAKNIIKTAWERAEKAYKKKVEKIGDAAGVVQDYLYYKLAEFEHEPPEVAEVKPLEGYADVPKDILLPYLAKDCDYTWQLYAHLRMIIDADPALKYLYETVLMPSSQFLQRVEKRGIFVDQGALKKLKVELTARKEAALGSANTQIAPLWKPADYLADTGAKTAPEHFNVASSKQLHWVIYNRLGMRPPKGVQPTTNKAVLPLLSPINNPIIPLILDYRKAAKMLSTYVIGVEAHIDKFGRVHSTYKIHGTETGRLSSADPNMQNIPSDSTIKNIFAAPPGFALLEMDYSQAELRTLACLSGDEALTEIYLKGLDLHYEMCVEIYGDRFLSCDDKGELERLRRGAKCMTPDTRILRADLRWVPLSEIKDGDEIIACDEEQPSRKLRKGKVVSAWRAMKELYEVEFADGTILKMTDDHPLLTNRQIKGTSRNYTWKTIRDGLKRGLRALDVWDENTSKEAGWLAGYFDGEGCVSSTNGRGCYQIGAPQSVGPTSDKAERLLLECGFQASRKARKAGPNPTYPDRPTKPSEMTLVTGGIAERMRFLGSIRPERLIENAVKFDHFGELRVTPVDIVRITPIGLGEVVSLETDTHTFIAEGFIAHNTVNFGICYGMGESLLASRLDIEPTEAARMIEVWFNRFPKAAEYLKLCRSMPRLGRYVDTPFGRRRRFPLVTAETLHKLQNEAANFPIQSVASDLTLMSGIELDAPLDALGASIVNIVHDSLLIQVPENDKLIREVFLMARAAMIQTPIDYLGPEVPFDADGKIGINWGGCFKYKLDAPLSLRKIA